MKLKHGKKYETADGVVVGPMKGPDEDGDYSAFVGEYELLWHFDGTRWAEGVCGDLIRRHYKKPKPAHKLDLKEGDVVELFAWEDGTIGCGQGEKFNVGKHAIESDKWEFVQPKGERPLFRVVSRA